ncbi:MAG: hypothetical protein K6A30_06325 [Lachnospiraceae bacterium]|nr:hypothetical protein [Lachnospiraceae bacterium]
MADILILDYELDVYKRNLTSLEGKYNFLYTNKAEQAMEWLEEKEIAVIIAEKDMEIITINEISDMVSFSHPETVLLLATDVYVVEDVLDILNECSIFEIVLKPFRFAEDIMDPIIRAVHEHELRVKRYAVKRQSKKDAKGIIEESDKLKKELYKRANDYSNLFISFRGIVEGNALSWGKEDEVELDDCNKYRDFVDELCKEYVNSYIFSQNTLKDWEEKLKKQFTNENNQCGIEINFSAIQGISRKKAKDVYFFIYMMAHLCKATLTKYDIKVTVEEDQQVLLVKVYNDPKLSMLGGSMLYATEDERVRKAMHRVIFDCMKRIYVKSMKGYENNPYIASATIVMDN